MKKLLIVRAPGLSPDEACRGDVSAHVSDLIADGSFAASSGAPDLASAGLAPDRVTVVDVPFRDAASFDEELGRLRAEAAGAEIAIVSETVFISQRWFREIKPGATLAPGDVSRLLASMLLPG
jgi:hypothetical protein